METPGSRVGDGWVPTGIDPSVPSIARAYDFILGGKDNFPADRALVDQIVERFPGAAKIATSNREVLGRAVRTLVEDEGVRQLIDIGSGLPTADNVHQAAHRHAPETRVVYVDNDPIVLAHGRALLDEDDRTTVIQADIREPQAILDAPGTRELIDFGRPVGVILSAILHHIQDDEDPIGIVRTLYDAVPSGSYFFITHFFRENTPEADGVEAILQESLGRGRWRERHEIEEFFAGLEILEPGIVPLAQWRPDEPLDRELTVFERLIVGGIGRKPARSTGSDR
jgi:hypothetical protein